MKSLQSLWFQLICDDSAQDLIEYALVAAFVGLGAVAAFKGLATSVTTVFTSIGTTLTNSL